MPDPTSDERLRASELSNDVSDTVFESPEVPDSTAESFVRKMSAGPDSDGDVSEFDDVRLLADRVADLSAAITALTTRLDAENDRAAAREQVITRLHDENQKLRAGERQLVLHPLLTSLQRLRSELLKQASLAREPISSAQAGALFESFAFTVEQALEAHGVVPLHPEPGAPYNPQAHRAVETRLTNDPALDGTIGATVDDGYTDLVTERPMRHAAVVVLRYADPTPESPKEAAQ